MSSSAALLRALSPLAESSAPLAAIAPSVGDDEKRLASRLHRQTILEAANSVDDVVALVPRDY